MSDIRTQVPAVFEMKIYCTNDDALVKGRVKSAAPASVRNAKRIEDIPNLGFWGPSQALTAETIETEGM